MSEERLHTHISSKHNFFDLRLREVWQYRDLILLYAKRSIVTTYKQTILGPAWLVLNPLLTSLVYLVIFGQIAKLSTGDAPQILFYLMGNASWAFFSVIIMTSADTFVANANLFGKVYFPRLVIPLANILVASLQFSIQLLLAFFIGLYYMATTDFSFTFVNWLGIPVVLLLEAALGLGFGIICSSLTTRYRDLRVLVDFGVRLWMFVTPVVYPMSQFDKGGLLQTALTFNPLTAPMEAMRWCLWGSSAAPIESIIVSVLVAIFVVVYGIMLFNKVERTFMDTV